MRGVLLIFAAAVAVSVLPAAPATAQSGAGASFSHQGAISHSARSSGHRGHDRPDRHDRGKFGDFGRDDDRGDRDSRSDVFFPYRDYQGDTLWRSNSFNDWWHDRPDRSFPRWLRTNQNCERQYWTGSGWRC